MACVWLAVGCASDPPRVSPPPAPAPCRLSSDPEVLLEKGAPSRAESVRLARWEVDADPVLWTPTRPRSPTLDAFIDETRLRVGDVSSERLLRRAAETTAYPREAQLDHFLLADLERLVVPMRCFDAIFLSRQTDRLNMIATPTEVVAMVFRSRDDARLRIIEYTVNQAGIGRIGPMMGEVAVAIEEGWHPWAAFHNHNFFFPEDGGWRGGSVAPSAPDAELMTALHRELGLEQAWITNGFSTSIIPIAEIPAMLPPMDPP
jgi:hypothetical protein